MSKIAVSGNASGTGTFTIQSPATNTDRTLTLPDEAGTVLTDSGYITADGTNLILKADGTNEDARIDSSGNLFLGTGGAAVSSTQEGIRTFNAVNDYWILDIGNTRTTSQATMRFFNGNGQVGSIATSGSATAYNTSSDYRLKEDWVPMEQSIERVKALNPVNFAWKVDGTRVDGFLAHEAQEVVPEAVTGTKDAVDDEGNPEYQGIDQAKLVPLLTAALQEAIGRIETLEAEVATLKGASA